jgi:ribonuclease BN (tRNA processing enzyme)
MRLTVLGSGTGIPSLERSYPGYFLSAEKQNILIDPGACSLRRLLELNLTYSDIDCVLFSHLHPDHSLDIVNLLFACRYDLKPRVKELLICGPNGTKEFYAGINGAYKGVLTPESYNLVIKETENDKIDFSGLSLTARPSDHNGRSVAFRIDAKSGKSLSYSGDTDICDNVISVSKNVDLAILECSFPDNNHVSGHLTPKKAAKIASESRCKRLLLSHFYPVFDNVDIINEVSEYYTGEIILAKDMTHIRV